MEFVENGTVDGPDVTLYLKELLTPHLEKQKVDAIVLGCTHYPFVAPVIRRIAGNNVRIFDGGPGTARELKRRLAADHLLNPSVAPGTVTFENSLPEKISLCRKLLKES
jgi:glutamate racemase